MMVKDFVRDKLFYAAIEHDGCKHALPRETAGEMSPVPPYTLFI